MLANLENVTLIVAGNDLIAMNAMRHLSDPRREGPGRGIGDGIRQHPLERRGDAAPHHHCAGPWVRSGHAPLHWCRSSCPGASLVNQRTIFEVSLVERDSVKCLKS